MKIDTIKVYKNSKPVVINKSELEQWNEAGYFTSSQEKKRAEEKKEAKEAEEKLNKLVLKAKDLGVEIPKDATVEEIEKLISEKESK